MRGVLLRSLAVLLAGAAVLAGILYFASTVDGRPPLVERIGLTQPSSGEPTVALTTTAVEVEFTETVDTETAEAAFAIDPDVPGAFSWSGSTLIFTPTERLPLETEFQVGVDAGVRDEAGNEMLEPAVPFAFVTIGNPRVVASSPVPEDSDVALDTSIVLEFSTLMDTASVEAALRLLPTFEAEATWTGETLTLTPLEPLEEDTRYTLTIGTGASDGAGNPLEEPFQLAFRTALSGLEAVRLVPADGLEGVAVTTPIAVFLDREVDPGSLDDELLTIEPEVAGSLAVVEAPGASGLRQPGERLLVFTPSDRLAPNTTYAVTLAGTLSGTDGSRLAAPVSWRFTTGAPLTTLSNQIVFLSNRSGVDNLWAMNPDGTGQRQVTAELSAVATYAVAPDGRTVIVGDGAVLVRQRADGGDREVLTPDDVLEFDPAWSPDGQRFAFGRSDAATGDGLGLWTRDAEGADATQLELPDELVRSPSPAPSGDEGEPAEVLRAPRYSPDGGALAFVTDHGRVGVLELQGRLTTAPFTATSPPAWLADSSGVLLSGLSAERPLRTPPGEPHPALDPAALGLSPVQLGSQLIVRLDRGARVVDDLGLDGSAIRPSVGADGSYLYIVSEPGAPQAGGTLWLVEDESPRARQLLGDAGPAITWATHGVEADTVVVSRAARSGDPGGATRVGIWLVDAEEGDGRQISEDGRMPRWLP